MIRIGSLVIFYCMSRRLCGISSYGVIFQVSVPKSLHRDAELQPTLGIICRIAISGRFIWPSKDLP